MRSNLRCYNDDDALHLVSGSPVSCGGTGAEIAVSPSALTMFSHHDVIRINNVHFVQVNDASASSPPAEVGTGGGGD